MVMNELLVKVFKKAKNRIKSAKTKLNYAYFVLLTLQYLRYLL